MTEDRGLGLKSWLSGPKRHEAKAQSAAEITASNKHRVAVLPFASMSPDPGDEYFADGMTEEVISTLSRVPEVEVISRSSIMRYKKDPKPVKEVSRELDVGTVLEGSVRKAGNRLRITVQMVDPAREHPVWADSFDRELEDVFAIQSEVAARVAQALLIKKYGGEASQRKNPTSNPEVYALYLKGRYYWNKRGAENIRTAINFFETAVKEDSQFALGYAGLAACFAVLATNSIEMQEYREKSKMVIAKALNLDPQLAEAHAARGLILSGEYRFEEAEKEFRSALTLNPSYANAHLWYYHLLRAKLRLDEALEHIERAIALDPLSPNMCINLAGYYYSKRDYQTALDLCKKAVSFDADHAHAHYLAGQMYGKLKMFEDAKRELGIGAELYRETYPLISKSSELWLAYFRNDKETVRKLLSVIEADLESSGFFMYEIAGFRFYIGDNEGGFEWLEQAYFSREYWLMIIQTYSEIPDSVRVDPKYLSLVTKLGLR